MIQANTDRITFKSLVPGIIGLLVLAVQKLLFFDFSQVRLWNMLMPIAAWLLLYSVLVACLALLTTWANNLITVPNEVADQQDYNRIRYRVITVFFGFCYLLIILMILYRVDYLLILTRETLSKTIIEQYQMPISSSETHIRAVSIILSWTSFDQWVILLCALLISSPISKFFAISFPLTLLAGIVNSMNYLVNQITNQLNWSRWNRRTISNSHITQLAILATVLSIGLLVLSILVIQYLCFAIVSTFFLTTDAVLLFKRGIIWSSSLGVVAGVLLSVLGGWLLFFRWQFFTSFMKQIAEQQKGDES